MAAVMTGRHGTQHVTGGIGWRVGFGARKAIKQFPSALQHTWGGGNECPLNPAGCLFLRFSCLNEAPPVAFELVCIREGRPQKISLSCQRTGVSSSLLLASAQNYIVQQQASLE